MKVIPAVAAVSILAALVAGCGGGASEPEPELRPPETFTWIGGQPVSFSPPPEGWKTSRYQNGGTEGVDFVKAGSGGEQILVAERLFVGRHDHCGRIRGMLNHMDDLDRRSFDQALSEARLYAQEPFNVGEERTIPVVNDALGRARTAFLNDDMAITQVELRRALENAGKIRFTIEETVDQALFTAEGNSVYPALQVSEPRGAELAGEPAVFVDFTFNAHGSPFLGRRIYLVKNNRMFELGFQGREENLPLFERVAESITFPPGPCEH